MVIDAPHAALQGALTSDRTRAEVFALVLSHGPLSRTDIARMSGLSQPTVTKAVSPLIEAGYLEEQGERSSGGRPQKLLRVNGGRRYVVGLKLGTTSVTGVRTDLEATVLERADHDLASTDPDAVVETAVRVVTEVLGDVDRDRVLGIGIAIGGHVDPERGVVLRTGLLGWTDVDIAAPLAAATGLPVVVNNDVNALVVEEKWFGAGRGDANFAVVTVGAGVGCGLVLGGELYAGGTGLAGELGHVPISADGPACTCGNRGCLEAIASEDGILRGIVERGGPELASIDDAIELARGPRRAGRAAARHAFVEAGDAVGRGIAVLLNVLNLQKVILSGEGTVASDLFGEALGSSLRAHSFSTSADDCELVTRQLGDEAWARGAACLVIREAVGAPPLPRGTANVPAAG